MSPTNQPSNVPEKGSGQVPALPRINAIAAIVVAVASLASSAAILILSPDGTGKAAAVVLASTGMALAARLGNPGGRDHQPSGGSQD
ncbi:hypothetical protein [Streptomyces sp. NPDC001401]|uniref:hypothetical protein n=1 Tax=Streptomyces sp. NPDC001401 TaxID=3364570 RepID=UPI0036CFE4D6